MMARLKWYLDPSSHKKIETLSVLDPLWQNFLDARMPNISYFVNSADPNQLASNAAD